LPSGAGIAVHPDVERIEQLAVRRASFAGPLTRPG
jgi:hypothetical protein